MFLLKADSLEVGETDLLQHHKLVEGKDSRTATLFGPKSDSKLTEGAVLLAPYDTKKKFTLN